VESLAYDGVSFIQGAAETTPRFGKLIKTKTSKIHFLILNNIHNVVLKFKTYITRMAAFFVDTLIEPLPVLFHDPVDNFERNGSNFLGYHPLKTF
jgi:hypothetical protein